jgi:hypothetical protein
MRALVFIALLLAAPAFAQGPDSEPPGCDKFKWPIDKERALLAAAAPVENGATLSQPSARLKLAGATAAKLPHPPTRQSKAGTYSGFLTVPAPNAGVYRITLSAGGWIDVFQNGHEVKSGAFTGAPGCDGIRKSVKFELGAAPYVIEITGVETDSVSVAVTAD